MLLIVHLLGAYVANLFKSRRRLEAENLFRRHQLSIAWRRRPSRVRLWTSDLDDPAVAEPARSGSNRRASHDPAVASGGVHNLLALEIPRAGRKTHQTNRTFPVRILSPQPTSGVSAG